MLFLCVCIKWYVQFSIVSLVPEEFKSIFRFQGMYDIYKMTWYDSVLGSHVSWHDFRYNV